MIQKYMVLVVPTGMMLVNKQINTINRYLKDIRDGKQSLLALEQYAASEGMELVEVDKIHVEARDDWHEHEQEFKEWVLRNDPPDDEGEGLMTLFDMAYGWFGGRGYSDQVASDAAACLSGWDRQLEDEEEEE